MHQKSKAIVILMLTALFAPQAVLAGGVDMDMDGFDVTVDCNDNDPDINPDAIEICDFIDNDCDDLIDDDDPDVVGQLTFFTDTDGDGFGNDRAA